MKRQRGSKPEYQLKIAKERIELLFAEAEKTDDKRLAKRYVELARKIGMRYNVRIPPELKRRYCKYCHNLLFDSRRRLKQGIMAITCKYCGKTLRYPYKGRN